MTPHERGLLRMTLRNTMSIYTKNYSPEFEKIAEEVIERIMKYDLGEKGESKNDGIS